MNVRRLYIGFVERSQADEDDAIAGAGIVARQRHEALRATRDALAFAAVGWCIDHLAPAGQELNTIRFDHCIQHKGTAGFPLAPTAVTAMNEERFAGYAVTNVAAAAAALLGSRRHVGG